jgi:hypothetical protein
MKRKTPQERKALSLERDRRSASEYNKAARKTIPRGKARALRNYRRKLKVRADLMTEADGLPEPAKAARVRKSGWRKYPGIPLGERIERQRESARERAGRKKRRTGR